MRCKVLSRILIKKISVPHQSISPQSLDHVSSIAPSDKRFGTNKDKEEENKESSNHNSKKRKASDTDIDVSNNKDDNPSPSKRQRLLSPSDETANVTQPK